MHGLLLVALAVGTVLTLLPVSSPLLFTAHADLAHRLEVDRSAAIVLEASPLAAREGTPCRRGSSNEQLCYSQQQLQREAIKRKRIKRAT